LIGSRAALFGRTEPCDDVTARSRFLARYPPPAGVYAGFSDFHFYRVSIECAHLVADFGKIHWVDGNKIAGPPSLGLQSADEGTVAHMNDDHADSVKAYATGTSVSRARDGASPAATPRVSTYESMEKLCDPDS
jgi:hypothetical protein